MPVRSDPWPPGTPCWVDLAVADVAAATAFYGAVVGWSFMDTGEEFGRYHIARTQGRAAAAIGPVHDERRPTAWTVYVASDDADATAKKIADNGGTVLVGPSDIPGTGRMLVALDATGGAFGVWQATGTIGIEIVNEPGSLTWTDVRLTDVEAGKRFYTDVFGYTYEPVPGAPDDYSTIDLGGTPVGGLGGMMGAPPGTRSHWIAYFSVADVDAAVAAAESAAGVVVMAPEDTPFGRVAVLTDPFGATFALHGPSVETTAATG
jgi:predicted enzyme related to lactoylglutathione lyase